jgi:hypothetical protein
MQVKALYGPSFPATGRGQTFPAATIMPFNSISFKNRVDMKEKTEICMLMPTTLSRGFCSNTKYLRGWMLDTGQGGAYTPPCDAASD